MTFAAASGLSGPNCRIASSYGSIAAVVTLDIFEVAADVVVEDAGGGGSLGRRMPPPPSLVVPPALAPGVGDGVGVVTGGSGNRPSHSVDGGRRSSCASTWGSPPGAACDPGTAVFAIWMEEECRGRADGDGGSGDFGGLLM